MSTLTVKQAVARRLERLTPRIAQKLKYFGAHGRWPNFAEPREFYEKLSVLKLGAYSTDPLVDRITDKLAVREYVKECGLGYLLTELYGKYDHAKEIRFDELPESFAIKASLGNGVNYFCDKKERLDPCQFNQDMELLDARWDRRACKLTAREGLHSNHFLVEELLREDGRESPSDYKFHCFGGVPKAISLFLDRENNDPKYGATFSVDWEYLSGIWCGKNKTIDLPPEGAPEPPEALSEMIACARTLSKPFPYLRVDLYCINGRVVFGELTPFPTGCVRGATAVVDGVPFGDLVDLGYAGRNWALP